MIFKLDQGIYICYEEEGEIIIPTETGFFNVRDYAKTCVVKWRKNVQAERALHFRAIFCTVVNQRGRTEKSEKTVNMFLF